MSDLFTRTYTFTDGTIAYGSQVEFEVGNIVSVLNNLNTAASNWGRISVLHASSVPLVADCFSGSQHIADFKNNSVIKASISSAGLITGTAGSFSGDVSMASINSTFIGVGRRRNLNGDCRFDQNKEGGTYTTISGAAHYSLDQWRYEGTAVPQFSVVQSTTAPTGFINSCKMTTTTDGVTTGSQGYNMEIPVEGPDMVDFFWGSSSAIYGTLQFRARASVTGTYSIAFLNEGANYSYVSTFVVSVADTWATYTVTVPGPTAGSWSTGLGHFGLKIVWDLGSGPGVTTSTLNTWQAASYWKATGSVSLVANAAAKLYLSGVQWEPGSTATAFEYMPYGTELARLQRYFRKTFPQGVACQAGQGYTGALGYVVQQPGLTAGGSVVMALPTDMSIYGLAGITYYNPIVPASTVWYNSTAAANSGAASTIGTYDNTYVVIKNAQVSTDAAGDVVYIHVSISAQVGGP